ncbi:MAG: putative inorganic carbon transporter subunit DabA, partial [Pseudomonadota bacterium]|nr:putative inorganic carbon transporter subunit DabA [Pseudomonadota bacterium]
RLLAATGRAGQESEAAAIDDLWNACLEGLELRHDTLHAEELVDLAPEQADRMLLEIAGEEEAASSAQPMMDRLVRREANHLLNQLIERVGKDLTLHTLLQMLTGHDVLEELRPDLLRQLANYLDQGVAAWHSDAREEGLYAVWRRGAARDLTWLFEELPDWYSHMESLPEDPMDTILMELRRLGLRQEKWAGYLERLALELPGWSGMFLWRHLHPGYEDLTPGRVEMIDYLAVRMVLEHLFAQRLCNDLWQVEASLDLIRWHFRHHSAEFLVRHALYNGRLPEYLASLAQRLTEHTAREAPSEEAWWRLAHMVHTWRQSPAADRPVGRSVYRSAWPLFRLCQHLGLSGPELRGLGPEPLHEVFDCLDRLTPQKRGFLWLQAYETHYRDQILTALVQNHGRGRWSQRDSTPTAQVIFCMDDREEGTRRHLEELEPDIETLGAAAHYNVPHNWRGLDDRDVTALAPVIPEPVIPAHEVHEIPRDEAAGREHAHHHARLERIREGLLDEGRRGLLAPALLTAATGPFDLLALLGKLLAPARFAEFVTGLKNRFEGKVATRIDFLAPDGSPPATPESSRLGYTDQEQAQQVTLLLRSTGLTGGFAPLVAIIGHGSRNLNNPHAPAYNCGACSGRFSGPNARLVAAMANRQAVRALLAGRGIEIPDTTWFVGAEHDTCNDAVEWFDVEDLPATHASRFERLVERLEEAGRLHARERCRRFASAPQGIGTDAAWRHVANRGQDISQARPELGHATNACAFFGRRSMSRGAFFDRRAFLISYDPTQDPEGEVLERHL